MANKTLPVTPELYDYLIRHSLREADLLAELRRETAMHPLSEMQIAPEQGQFMALLVSLLGARRVLEIGVFTGYSSLCMALALPNDGKLVACDVSAEYTAIAKRFWERAGVADRIALHLGPAIQTLARLQQDGAEGRFDLAFIDADKEAYDGYYERALKLVRRGGLILLDNMFRGGKVADDAVNDTATRAIRSLNDKLHHDDRIDLSLVPVGDGLTLARKR